MVNFRGALYGADVLQIVNRKSSVNHVYIN